MPAFLETNDRSSGDLHCSEYDTNKLTILHASTDKNTAVATKSITQKGDV
jgi:hypothetical protein